MFFLALPRIGMSVVYNNCRLLIKRFFLIKIIAAFSSYNHKLCSADLLKTRFRATYPFPFFGSSYSGILLTYCTASAKTIFYIRFLYARIAKMYAMSIIPAHHARAAHISLPAG